MQNNNLSVWKDASIISIVGPDAENFLQGYTTSDVSRCTSENLIPMAITDIKGRVLASGWSTRRENGIELIIHESLKKNVEAFLKPYIQFSKSVLAESNKKVYHCETGMRLLDGIFVRLMETDQNAENSNEKNEAVSRSLIQNNFTFVQDRVSAQFLPQQLGLHKVNAVDFDKGCYLGQEIVARVQFRGSIKKEISQIKLSSGQHQVGDRLADGSILVQVSNSGIGLAVGKIGNS